MEISQTTQHGVTVVAVSGRLDASNAGELEQQLLGLVAAGTDRLVIDCAGLEYISSAGLRVFLMVAKRLGASKGKLALAAVRTQIRDVLDIAGFSSILAIHTTRDQAVAAVA